MKLISYGAALGAAVMMSVVGFAQVPSPSQVQRPAPASGSTAAEANVTVVGCVQREADYRRTQDAGKGGVAGTGVGVGNEYVLINAMIMSAGSGSFSSSSGGSGSGAQGVKSSTAGSASAAFELTGPNESQAGEFVGKRVEIMGKMKLGDANGGPTAAAPPRGVDVTSKDLKLREIDVTSIKAASGTCPA